MGNWPRRTVAAEGSHAHYAEAGDEARQEGTGETSAATDAPLNGDVLFLYNAYALTVAQQRSTDPLGYIDGYSRASLATCNQALENSRVAGTVMAYADWLVPYFSNPHITLEATSTMQGRGGAARSLGTKTIGYPESDPRAAYNVRILNDSSAAIAALDTEDESVPQIWDQPRAQAVSVGGELQLRVAASGRNLSYQWRRDGTAIPGATDAAFTKTFSAGDAGSYSVFVANAKGSVTSDAATVSAATVTPTPSNPNQPATGGGAGGGGGGGGTPTVGFLIAIALLVGWSRSRQPTRIVAE